MESISKYIDYTLLKSTATDSDIRKMAEEASTYKFAALCIQPIYVKLGASLLKGSGVSLATVIGFPLGANIAAVKAFETTRAIADGATEVDMVMNIGALLDGKLTTVEEDIQQVVHAAAGRALVKVIIETAYLNGEQIQLASKIVKETGADYVKTSTGFAPRGASIIDIELIRKAVGPDFGIKASGGISSYLDAKKMIAAGATRLGASAALKIIAEEKQNL